MNKEGIKLCLKNILGLIMLIISNFSLIGMLNFVYIIFSYSESHKKNNNIDLDANKLKYLYISIWIIIFNVFLYEVLHKNTIINISIIFCFIGIYLIHFNKKSNCFLEYLIAQICYIFSYFGYVVGAILTDLLCKKI